MDFSIYVESGKVLTLVKVIDRKVEALSADSPSPELESVQFLTMVLMEQAEALFKRAKEIDTLLMEHPCNGNRAHEGAE